MRLKEILAYDKRETTESLSKKLEVSLSTVLRRHRVLEKEFLDEDYTFSLEKFGLRRVDFFISTMNGKSDGVAKDLLTLNQVILVGKSIGFVKI